MFSQNSESPWHNTSTKGALARRGPLPGKCRINPRSALIFELHAEIPDSLPGQQTGPNDA